MILTILLLATVTFVKGQTNLRYTEYELKDTFSQDTILLEIVKQDLLKNATNVLIRKTGVRFDKRSDPHLFHAFRLDSKIVNNSIRVIVDTRATVAIGVYELSFELIANKSISTESVKFNHPPAVLKDVADLVIMQEVPFFKSPSITKLSPFTLRETSGRSRILATLSEIPFNWDPDRKTFSTIHFKQKEINVAPGKEVTVEYYTTGSFPLGETKALWEINAPQLSSAKPISFTIMTKRPLYYLTVTLILGILLSFLLKYVLTNYISLNDSKLAAIEFISLIRKDQLLHLDEIFRSEADGVIASLTEEVSNHLTFAHLTVQIEREKKRIEALLLATKSDYDEILKRLDARRVLEKKNYEELLTLPFPLPASLQKIFKKAVETDKMTIEQHLKNDNISGLSSLLADLKRRMIDLMQNGIQSWKYQITDLKPHLAIDAELNDRLASLDISSVNTPLTLEEIKTTVPLLNRLHLELEDIIQLYIRKLTSAVNSVKPEVELYYHSTDKLDQLVLTTERYVSQLQTVSPEEALNVIEKGYPSLINAWKTTIYQPPLIAPDAQIDQLLTSHRYQEAVQRAVQLIKNPVGVEPGEMIPETTGRQASLVFVNKRTTNVPANSIVALPTNQPFQGNIEIARGFIERSNTLVKIFRLFLVAVVLVSIGYFIYDDNFVGKPDELFGIFLWTFTFDLSINTAFDSINVGPPKPKVALQ